MARDDYSAANLARLALEGTRPIYLVSIGFDIGGGAPWLITSYGQDVTVTGPGDIYVANGCRVSGIPDNAPTSTCTIVVPDSDRAVYALAVAQGPEQDVTVYRVWLPDGSTVSVPVADLVPAFVGRSGASFYGHTARFDCRSNASVKRAPAVRVDSSWCNWLRPVGTTEAWGSNTFTIEA